MNQLLRLLNLRRNEVSRVALAASVFFLVAVDDGIVKSVSAGVFNIREGVERLPEMYTWIAWLFALTMALLSYLTTKVTRQRLLFGLLGALCAVLALNTAALVAVERGAGAALADRGFYPFLFVSSELVRNMAGFQVWIIAGGICYTSRAKVLFPLLAASTTLGDIAGGFLVQILSSFLESFQIYGMAALIMGVVILLMRPLVRRYFITPTGGDDEPAATLAENARYFARSAYLKLLFILSIALFGLYTAIHYAFNVVARQHFSSEGEITAFFGLFFGTAGVATLITTTVLLRLLLRWLGVGNIYMWVCVVHTAIAPGPDGRFPGRAAAGGRGGHLRVQSGQLRAAGQRHCTHVSGADQTGAAAQHRRHPHDPGGRLHAARRSPGGRADLTARPRAVDAG